MVYYQHAFSGLVFVFSKYICLSCFFQDSWRNIQEGTDIVCYHNVHPVGVSDMYDFHLLVNATAKMAKSHSLYTL